MLGLSQDDVVSFFSMIRFLKQLCPWNLCKFCSAVVAIVAIVALGLGFIKHCFIGIVKHIYNYIYNPRPGYLNRMRGLEPLLK